MDISLGTDSGPRRPPRRPVELSASSGVSSATLTLTAPARPKPVYEHAAGVAAIAVVHGKQRGHAPRAGTNEHGRGSRRGTRSSSSSSDDPDGESDPDDDAPICECGCGHPARPNSVYATDGKCRVRAFRRRQAERDLVREATQLDTSVAPATQSCGCDDCRRARNGYYNSDPEVLEVLRQQREENTYSRRAVRKRQPRFGDRKRRKGRERRYFIPVTAETPFPFPIQNHAAPVVADAAERSALQ